MYRGYSYDMTFPDSVISIDIRYPDRMDVIFPPYLKKCHLYVTDVQYYCQKLLSNYDLVEFECEDDNEDIIDDLDVDPCDAIDKLVNINKHNIYNKSVNLVQICIDSLGYH